MRLNVKSAEQTATLAQQLAASCPETIKAVYLVGDLGAGKTTLVRAWIQSLGYDKSVKSPTYSLMERYKLGAQRVIHMDLYRLGEPEELEYLGIREMTGEEKLYFLIEWPDKGEGFIEDADLIIDFTMQTDGSRIIELQPKTDDANRWISRLEKAFDE
ncbi:MAG: tRNA (adenosine(37)-N6)-threonylcarbamoyltransferase complex ATPase subunit type 1 TsaE [bacterium]